VAKKREKEHVGSPLSEEPLQIHQWMEEIGWALYGGDIPYPRKWEPILSRYVEGDQARLLEIVDTLGRRFHSRDWPDLREAPHGRSEGRRVSIEDAPEETLSFSATAGSINAQAGQDSSTTWTTMEDRAVPGLTSSLASRPGDASSPMASTSP